MKWTSALLIIICITIAGCAAIQITPQNTTIVIAKEVEKEKGAKNISETFNFEGNIYVYITFRWADTEFPSGPHIIEVKWFNGEKLISTGRHTSSFNRTPWYVWFHTRGTNLGVGKCRVEVYADDTYFGSKSFTVVEK